MFARLTVHDYLCIVDEGARLTGLVSSLSVPTK